MKVNTELLEVLVGELIKDEPNAEKVKTLSRKCGIKYKADPLEQMQEVLDVINEMKRNQLLSKTQKPMSKASPDQTR